MTQDATDTRHSCIGCEYKTTRSLKEASERRNGVTESTTAEVCFTHFQTPPSLFQELFYRISLAVHLQNASTSPVIIEPENMTANWNIWLGI
jgi:hypothetical protein